jgi:hypothetical protein
MATSGSWDYSVTAAQIITAAAENLNIIVAGGTVASADSASMLQRLNFIAKQWQGKADMAQGLKVHTRQRITLFLAKGQQRYTIGPAATDARRRPSTAARPISAADASGTSLSSASRRDRHDDVSGHDSSDDERRLRRHRADDGTIGWTTINGTPAHRGHDDWRGLASAAAAGTYVWWFTSRAQHFPVLEYAVLRDEILSTFGKATAFTSYRDAQSYAALPDKTGDGDPTAILVEPLRLNTAITLNSQPTDVTKVINLTALYPAEDYDATSNDIAFPQEWFAALEWELTLRCLPMFPQDWTPAMEKNYQAATLIARQVNEANTALYFEPGRE